MTTRDVLVRMHGTTRTALSASWEHGVSLRAGDVVGASGSVEWAPGEGVIPASQVPHPLRPGWDREAGAPVSIDVDGQRVFTGMVASGNGSIADSSATSPLTDFIDRLASPAHVPPVAYSMPSRADLTETDAPLRHVGLWGTWITQLVMAQAGWNTSQSVQFSAIWYQSMAGSTWTAPNPDHAVDTLGHLTTVHRLGSPDLAPQVTQGRDVPVMQSVYALGSTIRRRRSSSTSWQLTVDMATDAPTAAHTGRVDIRTLPQSVGAGVRLDWTQTQMRVYRRNTDGSTAFLGSVSRQASMRWSVVVRQDGTATLHANDRLNALEMTSHGIALPSGPDAATVVVESEGPIGAVQVTRSDATSIVTQSVAARIHRSTFSNRSLPAFDYVAPRPAMEILNEQADAERSLLGMPLWMWIGTDGRLTQADPAYLAAQSNSHHFSNVPGGGIRILDLRWARAAAGPYQRVDVKGRFGTVKIRRRPTILVHEGRQQNYADGDLLDEFIHPSQDVTWLSVDYWPYFAGQPLGAGAQDLNNGIGSHVGGTVVTDTNGEPSGWITTGHIDGWTLDSSNHVVGALEVIDHRTILYKGKVNVGSGYGMSSMPSQNSAGLWSHRALQPLPQIRARGAVDWTERVESVVLSGNVNHPVLEHDAGMWCQSGTWRGQIGEALAQAALNPVTELTLIAEPTAGVHVGQRVTGTLVYPDGAQLDVTALVAGVSDSAPSTQMTVRLVLLSSTWTARIGAQTHGNYEETPPTLPRLNAPGTNVPERGDSYESAPPPPEGDPPPESDPDFTGPIPSNLTWSATQPYVEARLDKTDPPQEAP